VGPKTASRLTFYLLRGGDDLPQTLADALVALRANITYCQRCHNITTTGRDLCKVCADPTRDQRVICVVEDPLDVVAIERTAGYQGVYHVLHGALSPIEGIGPNDLKIASLLTRLSAAADVIGEVVIATNPSMEGDATAMYLRQQIAPLGVRTTRLAHGLPVGGDLEYADQNTLLRALAGRRELE
jgi:recombination protein RecR